MYCLIISFIFMINLYFDFRPPNLSELTPYKKKLVLTYLDTEASIFRRLCKSVITTIWYELQLIRFT